MSKSIFSSFESSRTVPVTVADLGPVAQDVMQHFRTQDYEVSGTQTAAGGWHISIARGDTFKAILGMKTALNIEIVSGSGSTEVKAGVGLFELQAIPTLITVFLFTPILFAQIWGLVQQEKLDNEAVDYVEQSLMRHAGVAPVPAAAPSMTPSPEI